jgi:MoaA/NifB/PqqE/SkfB family radical SAM enzyme
MVSVRQDRIAEFRAGIRRAAVGGAIGLASRSQRFREFALSRVSKALARSYAETTEDGDLLRLQVFFGKALLPVARRLIAERPRAARALARCLQRWADDVRRRTLSVASGAVAPATVVLEPTSRCNLNCPGCYSDSTRQGADMEYGLLEDTVEECADMGTTLITLSGGEPFLREQEDQAITRLAAKFPDLGFLVYTNSYLITEDVARRLGELGNVFPAISVEGTEKASDARRGEGYYRHSYNVRRELARNEVMHGASVTVTRRNANYVMSEQFVDRRIEEGDMFVWYFLLQPIGRSPSTSLMITSDQRARMREQLYGFRASGKPIFIGDFWNDGPFVEGCMAGGKYYFHIYANGDISPCVFAPVACGNMRDILTGKSEYKSLTDFVNRHPFFAAFRVKQHEITDYRAPCLLMDHPEKFRDVCARTPWYPALNMPDGYMNGEIARDLDRASAEWRDALCRLPIVPETVRNSSLWRELVTPSCDDRRGIGSE